MLKRGTSENRFANNNQLIHKDDESRGSLFILAFDGNILHMISNNVLYFHRAHRASCVEVDKPM